MQKFPFLDLNGAYQMALMPQKEYASLNEELDCLDCLKEHGCQIIPATVPGNFELDLHAAGLIGDPFYGSNTVECQKFENYHIFYSRKFNYTPDDGEPVFRFDGIDTFADIYLNGVLIGHTENMLIPHEVPACEALEEGENELFVHIYPTCIEARNYDLGAADMAMRYTYDSLFVRKAAHMFGWDIMPRAVSGGLWRPVSLMSVPEKYVREAYLRVKSIEKDHSAAHCELHYNFEIGDDPIKGYTFRIEGTCGDSTFEASDRLWFTRDRENRAARGPSRSGGKGRCIPLDR